MGSLGPTSLSEQPPTVPMTTPTRPRVAWSPEGPLRPPGLLPGTGWTLTTPGCPPGAGHAGLHPGSGHGSRWRRPSARRWCWSHPRSCSSPGPARQQSSPYDTRLFRACRQGWAAASAPAGADRSREAESGPQGNTRAANVSGEPHWVPASPPSHKALLTLTQKPRLGGFRPGEGTCCRTGHVHKAAQMTAKAYGSPGPQSWGAVVSTPPLDVEGQADSPEVAAWRLEATQTNLTPVTSLPPR